jgi:hypothetical protein
MTDINRRKLIKTSVAAAGLAGVSIHSIASDEPST